ncbi:MAG: hypothetical protein K8F29_13100 [Kofleriaceae bacterium]|nr:hypothetical protein [Candidatus Methylomirabilis lanthanidiphila]
MAYVGKYDEFAVITGFSLSFTVVVGAAFNINAVSGGFRPEMALVFLGLMERRQEY